ncbi:MAG: hypothetical protein COX65_08665 [Elusimicrobia bacterium CG_4_10_14_0_2_um_filter_56_8]|nr:MAG: hypothetical protein AUJ51_04090 [Elusimicrobia bacterium CG1_02_56_21]PJA12361.1 MAG: hypothetical protein COX65_08665 [Elusimicrobia bacterium CG_4_10_14_0_2_um_filter_56_8]
MRGLLAAVFITLACSPAAAAGLERGPYLESMAKDRVTVGYRTDMSSPSWVSYGGAPDCERFLTPVAYGKEHKVDLFGLLPDTTHCYRVYLPAYESTGVYKAFEGNFTTFRDDDKPYFSFLAFGDSGSASEEQFELAAQIEKTSPDFVVHTGDVLSDGLDDTADDQYFRPYAGLLSRAPFFLALGNHDYGKDFRTAAGKGFIRTNFVPFHSVPWTGLPPHYYFFDDANARFFVLDTNDFGGAKFAPSLRPGSKQYKWLERYLARSKDKAWKFVVVHHPLYSTGAHPTSEELVAALEPLFLKYKVDMVLQGHDHDYERTLPVKEGMPDPAGITYITLGGGGRPLYIQRRNEDWSAKFLPVYHFAVFSINDKNLKMSVYNKAGEEVDTLEIQK